MKLLIVGVNYNSYNELKNYIKSIDIAIKSAVGDIGVDFAIVDNTPVNWEDIDYHTEAVNIIKFPYHENLGYLGGASKALKEMGREVVCSYDYVIISNVDIQLSKDFFMNLLNVNSENVGWIVPSVYRDIDNSNENPFMISRPSKFKLEVFCFIYTFPVLFRLLLKYVKSARNTKNYNTVTYPSTIYAGMGSIIITSRPLVEKFFPYEFPAFMYGEEIYFAEIVRKAGMITSFQPHIKVYDICGVSTDKLNLKEKCAMMKSGILKMIDLFY